MSAASSRIRLRFIAWSILMVGTLAMFTGRVLPDLNVETDILALLPETRQDPDVDEAVRKFSAGLARKQIFLVGAPTPAEARRAADAFAAGLSDSGAFRSVQLELRGDVRRRADVYLLHRAWLLAPEDRTLLSAGEGDVLLKRALRAAYTPVGLANPLSLAEDPLGLVNDFIRAQMPATGNARFDESTLFVDQHGRRYLLVLTETEGSPFAAEVQNRVMPAIERAKAAAAASVEAPVDILSSGAIQHATAAAQRATHEIATFGTAEAVAVVVLLVAVFGALRPLLLGVLTLSLAIGAAFTVTHLVFGRVHLLALVFGSSLIGSVIDYSIHYFADRFRDPEHWTPVDAVNHVGPAILLGLVTTLIGYLVLALVPFPGLEQIAVFCMAGLVVGCGCVLCLYPVLVLPARVQRPLPRLGSRVGNSLDRFLQRWRWTPVKLGCCALALTGTIAGLLRIPVQDDVKALQQSPQSLLDDERRVRELLGSGLETRFFLVSGESPQAVLENEEKLIRSLDTLVHSGAISYYQAVSRGLPSMAQQQRDRELLTRQVYGDHGLLSQIAETLGFKSTMVERLHAQFSADQEPLDPVMWLASPASEGTRHLWLGAVGPRHASIVLLGGISDLEALRGVSQPGVRLVDRVAETSDILGRYRRIMSWLLAAIYCVAALVLLLRFGWREVPRMLLPSVLATLATLGIFGWLQIPFNLFTLLALWLVLGLGIDYGIFLRHGRGHRPTAILSVTLSASTTLIAFGLLAFSATPFIRSIGCTLLVAIALSWAFVLLSCLTSLSDESPRE